MKFFPNKYFGWFVDRCKIKKYFINFFAVLIFNVKLMSIRIVDVGFKEYFFDKGNTNSYTSLQ